MMDNKLATYKSQFERLNRANVRGERAPHKVILLLAIMDRINECLRHGDEGRQSMLNHPIAFSPHLEYFYYKEWSLHVKSEVFRPSYENPLVHMEYEPFYHLVRKTDAAGQPVPYSGAHSLSALEKAFEGIQLDAELLELLLNDADSRQQLRNVLLNQLGGNETVDEPSSPVFEHTLDYSFYRYGCTIDRKYHQSIFDVFGGRIERGTRRKITLRYEGKDFDAQIENVDINGRASDTIRCMWMGAAEKRLSSFLQQQFANDYKIISTLHENKINKLPEELKRIALFYNKEVGVFEMSVK